MCSMPSRPASSRPASSWSDVGEQRARRRASSTTGRASSTPRRAFTGCEHGAEPRERAEHRERRERRSRPTTRPGRRGRRRARRGRVRDPVRRPRRARRTSASRRRWSPRRACGSTLGRVVDDLTDERATSRFDSAGPQESAGPRAGRSAFAGRDDAVHDRCLHSHGVGDQPPPARGLVVDVADAGRAIRSGSNSTRSAASPGSTRPRSRKPSRSAWSAVSMRTARSRVEHAALAPPVLQRPDRVRRVGVRQDVGARVGRADPRRRVGEHARRSRRRRCCASGSRTGSRSPRRSAVSSSTSTGSRRARTRSREVAVDECSEARRCRRPGGRTRGPTGPRRRGTARSRRLRRAGARARRVGRDPTQAVGPAVAHRARAASGARARSAGCCRGAATART